MIVPLFTKLDRMLTLFVFVLFQVMCRCTCGHVTFSGGIRNLIVFGDISFKIQCTRLVLIGYKNVTGDIQKYVKIIMKNGFCNVKFCFGIALSKPGRPSSTHAHVPPQKQDALLPRMRMYTMTCDSKINLFVNIIEKLDR